MREVLSFYICSVCLVICHPISQGLKEYFLHFSSSKLFFFLFRILLLLLLFGCLLWLLAAYTITCCLLLFEWLLTYYLFTAYYCCLTVSLTFWLLANSCLQLNITGCLGLAARFEMVFQPTFYNFASSL